MVQTVTPEYFLLFLAVIAGLVLAVMPSYLIFMIAAFVVGVFPAFLTRYIHIILAAIMVIVIRFMPNKIYNSMYPALISVGSKFGLAGVDVIALVAGVVR